MVRAVTTASAIPPSLPSTSAIASWLAPAKSSSDIPTAWPRSRPAAIGAAPATRPNGMMPTSIGVPTAPKYTGVDWMISVTMTAAMAGKPIASTSGARGYCSLRKR